MSDGSSQSVYEHHRCFWSSDIFTAASLGDIRYFVKINIGKLKTDVRTRNSFGWTPLMYACSRGHSSLVNYLLMFGAERECESPSGVTPLMLAVASGDLSTVQSVFDPSGLERADYRRWTALFYAIHFTREKCLGFLLEQGADVNSADYRNETPLMMAIKTGRETMIELVLGRATNLNVVSHKRESALFLADESNCPKIKFLVEERHKRLLAKGFEDPNAGVSPPEATGVPKKLRRSPLGRPSPTLLMRPIPQRFPFAKSLTYSPNEGLAGGTPGSAGSASPGSASPGPPPPRPLSPWKLPAAKKNVWSPRPRPRNQVQRFLERLGLEKYWPVFRDEEVDFETLVTLSDDNLKELGIGLFGPRKKILSAIQQMKIFQKNQNLFFHLK